MPYLAHDLRPVTHVTIDTIGEPGERTFFLQASLGEDLVSLVLEKEQARALADGIVELLEELERVRPQSLFLRVAPTIDLRLKEPLDPEFRVGQMQLGYHEEDDLLVLVVQELTEEDDAATARMARLWATREQMRALSDQALQVVAGGRPLCPLCGEPMSPTGHFCARGNGHQLN